MQRRVSAVAYKMDYCCDIVFAVSAIKSMRIVRVGCCDSEAVSAAESIVTRNAALRVHFASFFLIRDLLRSSRLPTKVIWQ